VEVIDPSRNSREKWRIEATIVIDQEQDIMQLQCIGLDSKKDAYVPVLEEQPGEDVRVFKTKASVDHLTFTVESGTVNMSFT
jgi:hypothetical protein